MAETATDRVLAQIAAEAKFCPACGGRWLGGVMGDRSVLGCCDCGQRVPKLLVDVGENPRRAAGEGDT